MTGILDVNFKGTDELGVVKPEISLNKAALHEYVKKLNEHIMLTEEKLLVENLKASNKDALIRLRKAIDKALGEDDPYSTGYVTSFKPI